MGYTIPIDVASIYYDWDMPLIWLNILYFAIIIVVGYFFVRKLNYIRHIYKSSEEEKKKDEDFFNYLSQRKPKEEK